VMVIWTVALQGYGNLLDVSVHVARDHTDAAYKY